MTYSIGDMIGAFLLGLVLGACVVAFAVIDNATASASGRIRTCYAPCVVKLPLNTLEDEFAIDYGWQGNTPVVRVRVRKNG